MPNTTFSTTDKTASVTLSGGNLTAACAANAGVRATDGQIAGKFYFEVTATTWAGIQPLVGIANSSAPLASMASTPTGCACLASNSLIVFLNGSQAPGNPSLGTAVNGQIAGVAVDVDNHLIWFRIAPSGNWNGNASYAPGGTGGVNFSSLGGPGFAFYPAVGGSFASSNYTANFGDVAFSGAVPSGYTAGWPTSTISTSAIVSTLAVEEWFAPNPLAQVSTVAVEEWVAPFAPYQVTQAALEHWFAPSPQLQVTQAAIEHWVSVAATYPVPPTPSMMLSASRAGIGSVVLVQDNVTRDEMVSDVGVVSQTGPVLPFVPPTGLAYHITAGRAGVASAVVTQASANTFALSLPAVLAEAPAPTITIPTATVTLIGVAATGVAGTIAVMIPIAAQPAGVAAIGMAGAIVAFPGPVAFPAGVYATGQTGSIFAIAGGVVEKFIFFMAGPF